MILTNCGFKPIYNSKNSNFEIIEIENKNENKNSFFIEKLTSDLAEKALGHIDEINKYGGMTEAIEKNIPKMRIEESATKVQARIDSSEKTVVGVNKFTLSDNEEEKKDILGQELNGELKKLFGKKDNCLSSGEWDEICMLNLCFDINEEMSGKFRINELGYDMNKYVSYDKGCYRGQEIIARLTYLGKKTKKVVVFNSRFEEITNADDRPIGKKICSLDSKDKEYSHFFVESTDYFSEGKKITPVTNQWDLALDQ